MALDEVRDSFRIESAAGNPQAPRQAFRRVENGVGKGDGGFHKIEYNQGKTKGATGSKDLFRSPS